ncbi:acyl-ACP--UDP-N-acetylglucosamine O-acyltransferase [Thermodesulforhabdus norvegica]|uniref:Acyl-[acyl-carrier-protein]--UDP-N-acetylglucosamine O-acyltransferase n=1 Tax=Thermodesulforhabdus norvegica TaxID=39841 RepID=A0A1I4UPP0_9BACT|nr:acyl-ACP--UDP-N-acetylglucosamine O-acyltransferase [Thermodesulforhabdus norvegica]SFM90901.1 acyl-[acyl-carrier-protein]--UDP-N-acetylglucosamine O-acyltransferase [Thermodesulforhabdus norvegica]
MVTVHPTAIISPSARIGDGTVVEAYTVIGPEVVIGRENRIGPHVVITGRTHIGDCNRIYPFVSIGYPPQDLSYSDEPTEVVIGNHNVIREGVTIHRGTVRGRGRTEIGDHNYLMAWCHVAHDCVIGNHVIMANGATLAGHVTIGDHAVVGGLVAVHQFVRIGEYAFIGGKSAISMDVPPFMLVSSERETRVFGPNKVGLKRKGFSTEALKALKKAYKILFRSGLTRKEAIEKVKEELGGVPEVTRLVDFVESGSQRGITR